MVLAGLSKKGNVYSGEAENLTSAVSMRLKVSEVPAGC